MTLEIWQKLTLSQQLGNIASEFSRAVKFKEANEQYHSEKSFEEVLALLNQTIGDKRWKNRLRELTRLREVVSALTVGKQVFDADPEVLTRYFQGFAIAARNSR
ncbi:MAG: hypothetical protein U1C57_01680 [Candidatus Doudnabacteria bacterium]|nr:hypothetical protein [bacterium]MDZ4243794.1 hypothetical protein [Candidatus Doudnabacteria bacterium]